MSRIERSKYKIRVEAGEVLHRLGLYRRLLPVFLPNPSGVARRLQSYLNHFYEKVEHAEADLYLPDLGLTFACDIKDHMLWPYLENEKPIYELTDINHCRGQVRPNDHIVDIGANHGFWGFTLAFQAGTTARVYLCEANPSILPRLIRTAELNPNLASLILPYAITDGTAANLAFYLPDGPLSGLGSTVLHAFATGHGYLSTERQVSVAARSLDALMDDGTLLGMDVVKIDVEQAEDAVVNGAQRALQRFRPRLLMVETALGSGATKTLQGMGYQTYCLDEAGHRRPVPTDYWGNIFFVWA